MNMTSRHQKNMTQNSRMTWFLLLILLWILPVCPAKKNECKKIRKFLTDNKPNFIAADNYNGIVSATEQCDNRSVSVLMLNKTNFKERQCNKILNVWEDQGGFHLLSIGKWHVRKGICLHILHGKNCSVNHLNITGDGTCDQEGFPYGNCTIMRLNTKDACSKSKYQEDFCRGNFSQKKRYTVNITRTGINCYNCNNPLKKPDEVIVKTSIQTGDEEDIDPAQAAEAMSKVSSWVSEVKESSASMSLGGGISGVLMKQTETSPEDMEEVSFGFSSHNSTMDIIDTREYTSGFSRSVTIPKQAFEKAYSLTSGTPFVGVFRFPNMAKDEMNSTVLDNEVLAIEMGAVIKNLTDDILINFRNIGEEGSPSCTSWDGKGSRPNWTDDGCETIIQGQNVTCQCTHLTFFAVLMSPPNVTLSSADLNALTYITSAGCGLSMFFLSIVLFMHFLMRKSRASEATHILIHLVIALFLLNLTFLTNNSVTNMTNPVACKIMAGAMHYSMLATFTWFAVKAVHLNLQLFMAGKITIHHYILKVSITSWALPSVAVIVLFSLDKYGEQVIKTDASNVTMCWITDSDVHYAVNIGYYAVVFLLTFTTFITTLVWLFHHKKTSADVAQLDRHGKNIFIITGLCCMLGITWSFAFFAHGALRVPSYYIFTILNSFQGFFLFLYYYKTQQVTKGVTVGFGKQSSSSTSGSTLKTTLNDPPSNPYAVTNPQSD
ncbi:adhesion G-protein coupled receptor G6-like isoform X2 [Myripristis murdjan]|uniref:adhesion G-protein coupled receptor G6-like isoform X2 n=1 Tax=Myripristis murdjan TaxID=586833 RepID=UPI0011763C5B|nr:adhesion G-protein coupled receptor G6-like isoform X2 [Myripristis murdjan]